jgi:ankyrin repeat protein
VSCGKKKYPPEYFYHDSNVIELCNAITKQDEHKIDELLKQNTDINAIGKDGMTPLLWALNFTNKKMYEIVLKKGGDPNIKITEGSLKHHSVMSLVCKLKDNDYLKITLKYIKNSGNIQFDKSILSYAIRVYSFEKTRLIVEAGADINKKDDRGDPPLILAAIHNQYDIVYYLLKAGADPMIKADPLIIPSLPSNKDDGLSLVYLIEQSNELMSRKGNQYQYLLKCAKFLKDKGIKVDVSKPQKYPKD